MFEIKAKDNRGRVGVLKTNSGDVKTPNFCQLSILVNKLLMLKNMGQI